MDTASIISLIMAGSLILDTPPATLISAGILSRAITATAPAASAIFACSGLVTSIITPPINCFVTSSFFIIFVSPFHIVTIHLLNFSKYCIVYANSIE